MREDEIDDKMLWKKAAERQEIFVRDHICTRLLNVPVFVVSTHHSKSIELPVYGFTMRNGIKVYCRENFYGWKLSVELPKERPYADIIPEDLFEDGYKGKKIPSYNFEGFKDEWCHCSYRLDVKQRKFSFGIYSDYKFYVAMYLLSHLYEPVKFDVNSDKVTKENVANSIRSIYERFGAYDMRKDESWGGERPVMSPWELMWNTYSKLDNYKFKEKNGLSYEDVKDIDKDPERFAEMIIRFPELTERFLIDEWLYNQEY